MEGDKSSTCSKMYKATGTVMAVDPLTLTYDTDTYGGQSGSPVYYIANDKKAYADTNMSNKMTLADAKEALKISLGINRVGVDIPIPDTDEEFSTVEYTDKIISITNYSDGIKQINFKDSYIFVTDNIKIIKDGIEVSVDELKAGSIAINRVYLISLVRL